jgi:hypothetical protein
VLASQGDEGVHRWQSVAATLDYSLCRAAKQATAKHGGCQGNVKRVESKLGEPGSC